MKIAGTTLAGVVLIGFLSIGSGAAQEAKAESPAPTKEQLQQLYMDYLTAEGYRPEIDQDGDVKFKREGKTLFILVTANDPEFFQVILPNIWPIEDENERMKVLAAADYSNATSKASKVFINSSNVWVAIEMFVASPGDFKGVFNRALASLDNGASKFAEKMYE